MKHRSLFLILTLLLTALPVFGEKMKVGTVNMRKLLNSFHETKIADAEGKVERDGLRKKDDERMTAIKAIQEELSKLKAEFDDPSLSAARRKKVAGQFQEREENLRMLGRERDEFLERSRRAIQEKMIAKMNDLRGKVMAKVQAYAATQDVDYVIDSSGITSAQVPFLLYVREPVDITEGVLVELNKDAPKTSEPAKPKK